MKKIIFVLLIVLVSFSFAKKKTKVAKLPQPAEEKIVVTSIPALESLAKEILKGTPISVVNPFGNEISIDELDGIDKQFETELDTLSPKVAAVLTIRSVIPTDRLFIQIRHRNITAVEIECANPLSPVLTAIGTIKTNEEAGGAAVAPFVWLSLSNSIRMAEVLQSDLSALFPKYAEKITANLADFKMRANNLRNEFNAKFLEIDNFNAVSLSGDFDYLLKDIDLFVIEKFPPEYEWNEEQTQKFSQILETQPVGVVINRWETGTPADEIMKKFEVNNAVLKTGFPAESVFAHGFLEFWKENVSAILSAMSK